MTAESMTEELKFFCDEQLGKLNRWLRIIGQDSLWERRIPDEELLERAAAQGRIVLTRDTRLPEKARGVRVIVLQENYPALQLREVVEMFKDRMRIRVFSRCPVCNGELYEIKKEEVAGKVPPFVFKTQKRFTRCPDCGKIYWQATHRERVDTQLRDILGPLYQGGE